MKNFHVSAIVLPFEMVLDDESVRHSAITPTVSEATSSKTFEAFITRKASEAIALDNIYKRHPAVPCDILLEINSAVVLLQKKFTLRRNKMVEFKKPTTKLARYES